MKQFLDILKKLQTDANTLNEDEFDMIYNDGSIKMLLTNPSIINESISLYRGRLARDVSEKEDLSSPSTFSYVPLTLNKYGCPQRGRANYKGQSIFYSSVSMKTNFREICKDSNMGDEAYMAKWVLKSDSNLYLYRLIPESGIDENKAPRSILYIDNPKIVKSELGDYLKKLGHIMMSNDQKGKYLASSCIANCIYNTMGIARDQEGKSFEFHYDGILYPSAISDNEELNIALKPDFVDSNLRLEWVIKGLLSSDARSVEFKQIGINESGRIEWYEPFFDESSITNIVPKYIDLADNIVDTSNGIIIDANGHVVKSEMSAFVYNFKKYGNQLLYELWKAINYTLNESQIVNKESLEIKKEMLVGWDLTNWKYVEEEIATPLVKVWYEFTLKVQLRHCQQFQDRT